MLSKERQFEIIQEATAQEYKGDFTDLFIQEEKAMQQQQSPQQEQQIQEQYQMPQEPMPGGMEIPSQQGTGDLVQSYQDAPPGLANNPMGENVSGVVSDAGQYETGGFHRVSDIIEYKKGGEKTDDNNSTWKTVKDTANWFNPLFVAERFKNQIPLNVRQFSADLIGSDNSITKSDLNYREKQALENARKNAEKRGSSVIEYEDYGTHLDDEGNAYQTPYDDVGGGAGYQAITKSLNPAYSVKSTFGQMGFKKKKDGTYTYNDQYNFNDATGEGWKGWKKGVKKKGFSIYGQLRNIATNFGSKEGEGSKVKIKMQRGGYKIKRKGGLRKYKNGGDKEEFPNLLPEVEVSALTDESYNKLSAPQKQLYDTFVTPGGVAQTVDIGNDREMHWKGALQMAEDLGVRNIYNKPTGITGKLFQKLFARRPDQLQVSANPLFKDITVHGHDKFQSTFMNSGIKTLKNNKANWVRELTDEEREAKIREFKDLQEQTDRKGYFGNVIAELAHIPEFWRWESLKNKPVSFAKDAYRFIKGEEVDHARYRDKDHYEHKTHTGPDSFEEKLREKYKIKRKGGVKKDYNIERAKELGYTRDKTGHLPSVDVETGDWLKSMDHPTAWKEYMEYSLNPKLQKEFQLGSNPEGYFGDRQLKYYKHAYQKGGVKKENEMAEKGIGLTNETYWQVKRALKPKPPFYKRGWTDKQIMEYLEHRKLLQKQAQGKGTYGHGEKGVIDAKNRKLLKEKNTKTKTISKPRISIGGPLVAAMLSPLEAGRGSTVVDPKTGINKYTGEKEYTPFQKGGLRKYHEGGSSESDHQQMLQSPDGGAHHWQTEHGGNDPTGSTGEGQWNPQTGTYNAPEADVMFKWSNQDGFGVDWKNMGAGLQKAADWGKGVWNRSSGWGKAGLIAGGIGLPLAGIAGGLNPGDWFKKGGVRQYENGGNKDTPIDYTRAGFMGTPIFKSSYSKNRLRRSRNRKNRGRWWRNTGRKTLKIIDAILPGGNESIWAGNKKIGCGPRGCK